MSGFDEGTREDIAAEIARQFILKDDCITELQRENAALKADNAELRARRPAFHGSCGHHCEACAQLKEQLKAAMIDAERYRFLRSGWKGSCLLVCGTEECHFLDDLLLDDLDRRVDAEIRNFKNSKLQFRE